MYLSAGVASIPPSNERRLIMKHTISRVATMLLLGVTVFGVAPGTADAQAKPALVRNVDEGALQPIQFNLFPHSSSSGQNAVYFNVPAGKRLVIEYYSAQAQDLSGGASGMTIGTTANGNFVSYIVYVNKADTNAVNQTTRIYADPGTVVQAFAFNGGGATSCGATINISGYLVNFP
jgi:hypothetical protein